jgi:hypothetical protein
MDFSKFISDRCPNATALFVVIRGSHAYGTNIETSDTDYAGVFIQPIEDILGMNYKEQINDDKNDIVFYEIRRFLELIGSNNPTILELLNTPEDCIVYKHPAFQVILDNSSKFISKKCAKSFGGYAVQQIKRAKGLNKKQNWEDRKVVRKTPIDFCYAHIEERSMPLQGFLTNKGMDVSKCGLSKIPHGRDTYALFYDRGETPCGMRGIAFEDSNDIRLSSIPNDNPNVAFVCQISFNKDGYSEHCKDYKEYSDWLEKRNVARWVEVKTHGQQIDGKNMMHCRRLLKMACEIARGEGINVRRPDREELLSIRRGEVDLQTLIDQSEDDIAEMDRLFIESNLPDNVPHDLTHNLLVEVRKQIYFS